jgi:hypothetical protein
VHLPSFLRRRCALPHSRTTTRLVLELLETRNLLSVNVQSLFRGLSGTAALEPPDTIAAAGPDVIVEMVNTTVAYYDKNSGGRLFQQDLSVFFRPLGGVLNLGDVVVVYDELAGRFALGVLDFNLTNRSRLDFAVSNTSNPLDGFQLRRFNLDDGLNGFDFADYPRIGYNADAYVLTFNMFPQLAYRDHVNTLAIDKNSLVGHRVQVPGGAANFTMAPASMHDAQPSDPMWFTESASEYGGNTIGVVQMSNVLSDTPTFTITQVPVPDYFFYPFYFDAIQPFSAITINIVDDRITNSAMRFRQIVAGHSVGTIDSVGLVTHVRWYQFDTTGDAPVLVQLGEIDQGAGVFTYYPSIEMNTLGDLGMTFMESSDSEYMSMYVTGRQSSDPLNTMQRAVLVFPGQDRYLGFRAGDFSGTTVDPVDGITFWSANEFKPRDAFWGTGIASFSISSAAAPPGSANPSEGGMLLLPTSDLGKTISHASPDRTMVAELGIVVVDGYFGTSKEQRRQVVSSEFGPRSRPAKEESRIDALTAHADLWDRG